MNTVDSKSKKEKRETLSVLVIVSSNIKYETTCEYQKIISSHKEYVIKPLIFFGGNPQRLNKILIRYIKENALSPEQGDLIILLDDISNWEEVMPNEWKKRKTPKRS